MDNLVVEKTKSSPTINFNAVSGKCEISGSSYPENASEFYGPVLDWITKYTTEITRELYFTFCLDYLNSSSIKFISEIVDRIDKYGKIGITVEIEWHYKEEDEDILELGEEFKEEVSCKFTLVED